MGDYNFVKMNDIRTAGGHQAFVSLNKNTLNISRAAYILLGEPERIGIWYDTGKSAIQIDKDPAGRLISTKYPHLSSKLARIMPIGRYIHSRDGIFVLETKGGAE